MALEDSSSDADLGSQILSYPFPEFNSDDGESTNVFLPFMYEPEAGETASSSDEDVGSDRLGNTDWCLCGSCVAMPTGKECICCHEVTRVMAKLESGVPCITQHPGFAPVCLNTHVLQTAYFSFRQQYGNVSEGSQNDQYRHTAYRQLTRWCWEWLGRNVRVVLPSCAVHKIRSNFPSQSGQYAGFEEAQMSD